MNDELLEKAKTKVSDVRVLINGAARRAAELARGARPLVSVMPNDERGFLDIALEEIVADRILIKAVY